MKYHHKVNDNKIDLNRNFIRGSYFDAGISPKAKQVPYLIGPQYRRFLPGRKISLDKPSERCYCATKKEEERRISMNKGSCRYYLAAGKCLEWGMPPRA